MNIWMLLIRKRYIQFLIFRNLKLTQKNKIMHLHYKIYSIQRVLSHCLLIREERFFSFLWSLISVNCVIRTSELIIARMRNYYIVEPYPIRDSYIFINGGQISEIYKSKRCLANNLERNMTFLMLQMDNTLIKGNLQHVLMKQRNYFV